MAEVNMTEAKKVYSTLIKMLDGIKWKYQRHDEKLAVVSDAQGEDLPIEVLMAIEPKQELVHFISRLPFKAPEDKRVETAIAICAANYGLVDGRFELNIQDGEISFRIATSYRDSAIGKGALEYILMTGIAIVDAYNDKLFMLTKGVTTIEQFIEQQKNQ